MPLAAAAALVIAGDSMAQATPFNVEKCWQISQVSRWQSWWAPRYASRLQECGDDSKVFQTSFEKQKVVLKKKCLENLVKAQAAFATAARAELQRAAQRTAARRLEEARIVQRVMAPMAPMDGADTEATATSGTLRAFGLEFFCCSAVNSLIKNFEIYGNCVLICFNIFFLMNFCSSYLVDPVYQIDCTVSRPDVRSPTLALSEGQGRFRGKDVGYHCTMILSFF